MLAGFAKPVLLSKRRLIILARGGGEMSYHTKLYNEITNSASHFFCTGISFLVYVAMRLKYSISQKAYLTLSGFYNHIFNRGMKQPNYRIKFPTAATVIDYYRSALHLRLWLRRKGIPLLQTSHNLLNFL